MGMRCSALLLAVYDRISVAFLLACLCGHHRGRLNAICSFSRWIDWRFFAVVTIDQRRFAKTVFQRAYPSSGSTVLRASVVWLGLEGGRLYS